MNLDSINKVFQAFSNDRLGNANVSIRIDIGLNKSPVTIPVQSILLEKGAILIKGEVPNIDVLNKPSDIVPDLMPTVNSQDFSSFESLSVEKVKNDN